MNFKQLRKKHNLTQEKVADYLNITTISYSRYENGTREPSIASIKKLADLYQVSVDYLIDHKGIEQAALSDYELQLVEAARRADKRACADALELLLMHCAEDDQKKKDS